MTKTIGIVANTSFNIYNFRLGLLKHFKKEGYNVIAFAPFDNYTEKVKAEGFKIVELKKTF